MVWQKRKKKPVKKPNYSFIENLRREGKSTELFETMVHNLTLEELLGVKLELASRGAGYYLYGLPLFQSVGVILQSAMLEYAKVSCATGKEMSSFLGVGPETLPGRMKLFKKE